MPQRSVKHQKYLPPVATLSLFSPGYYDKATESFALSNP